MENSTVQEEKQEPQNLVPKLTPHVFLKKKSVILVIGILFLLMLILISVLILKQNSHTHSLSQVHIIKQIVSQSVTLPRNVTIVPSPHYLLNGTQPSNIISLQPTVAPILPSTVVISGVTPSLNRNEVISIITKLNPQGQECNVPACPFTPRLNTALTTAINYANKVQEVTPGAYTYTPIFRDQNSAPAVVDSVTPMGYGKVDIKITLQFSYQPPSYDLIVEWTGTEWLIDDVQCDDDSNSEYHTPYPQPC